MERNEVSTSIVMWSEQLSNTVSIIIRRYIDHMRFAAHGCFVYQIFFIFLWFYFVSFYIWFYVLYASV